MAHFAQIQDGIVVTVNVIHNNDAPDEATGLAFCRSLWGAETQWVQTSYNASFRKNFAGVGYTYDETRDAFIPPSPGEGWTLDEDTCQWLPPPE